MRILVTGSRDWTDKNTINIAIMHQLVKNSLSPEQITIVHGDAPGADTIAAKFAAEFKFNVEPHPAEWKKFGKAAGPKRNQEMVDLGADVCLAFLRPFSKGTAGCIKKAQKAGIPVHIYAAEGAEMDAEILMMPPAKPAAQEAP